MPPLPLRLMIIEPARLSTLRARPVQAALMPEMDVHLALRQLQFNPFDLPWRSNPKDGGVKFPVLQSTSMLHRPTKFPDAPFN